MATGAKARYKMPAFRSLAGPSPNCCAVLVQIEHCAKLKIFSSKKETTNTAFLPARLIFCFNIGAKLSLKWRLKKTSSCDFTNKLMHISYESSFMLVIPCNYYYFNKHFIQYSSIEKNQPAHTYHSIGIPYWFLPNDQHQWRGECLL